MPPEVATRHLLSSVFHKLFTIPQRLLACSGTLRIVTCIRLVYRGNSVSLWMSHGGLGDMGDILSGAEVIISVTLRKPTLYVVEQPDPYLQRPPRPHVYRENPWLPDHFKIARKRSRASGGFPWAWFGRARGDYRR